MPRAGLRDQLIRIETQKLKPDPSGQLVAHGPPQFHCECWASHEELGSGESSRDPLRQTTTTTIHQFGLPVDPDTRAILTTMQVVWDGRTLQISGKRGVGRGPTEIFLDCVEMV